MIFNTQLLHLFHERSEKYGLRVATLKMLEDLGVNNISKKGTLPANGPLLIISNHTGLFDTLLLESQVERTDVHSIALSIFGILSPKVKEKLLPIYMIRDFKHMIYENLLRLQIEGKLPKNLTQSEIKTKNRETIAKAAKLINKGMAVSIFPTGSAGKPLIGAKWKAGIGFLVKQISHPKTRVVFADIKGSNDSEIFAYLHPVIRKLLFKPRPLSIHFSKPIFLDKLVNRSDDGKTIAAKLENLYKKHW